MPASFIVWILLVSGGAAFTLSFEILFGRQHLYVHPVSAIVRIVMLIPNIVPIECHI
jgi:hypothetical protein